MGVYAKTSYHLRVITHCKNCLANLRPQEPDNKTENNKSKDAKNYQPCQMRRDSKTNNRIEHRFLSQKGNIWTGHNTNINGVQCDHCQDGGQQMQYLEFGIQDCRYHSCQETSGQSNNQREVGIDAMGNCHSRDGSP